MDETIAVLATMFAGMAVGALAGFSFCNHDILEECRKQHNVYECVVVAVPKDKEGVYK